MTAQSSSLNWVPVEGDYALALDGNRMVCRNPKGKVLAKVPKKVRESEAGNRLMALPELMERHRRQCFEAVETWMLRSLPVPREVVAAVWPDPRWRDILRHAVVVPWGENGPDSEAAGFLLDADERRIDLMGLDGQSRYLETPQLGVPHPILLPELDSFRKLATELELKQNLRQLFRKTYGPPPNLTPKDRAITEYQGGFFATLIEAIGAGRALGYGTSGGFAVVRVWENGRKVEARYWLGTGSIQEPTETGRLSFHQAGQGILPLVDVGPVAMSEGRRMAAAIFERSEEEAP